MNYDEIATAKDLAPRIKEIGVPRVAEVAGLTHTTVYLWLDGRRKLALEARLRVAEACGFRIRIGVYTGKKRVEPVGLEQSEGQTAIGSAGACS